MRLRPLLTAGTTAVLLGVLPTAAMAQDISNDPDDLDSTFVPSAPAADTSAPAPTTDSTDVGATDQLPNTGGGLALAGGATLAGAALLRGRRR